MNQHSTAKRDSVCGNGGPRHACLLTSLPEVGESRGGAQARVAATHVLHAGTTSPDVPRAACRSFAERALAVASTLLVGAAGGAGGGRGLASG